eukprot:136218_1
MFSMHTMSSALPFVVGIILGIVLSNWGYFGHKYIINKSRFKSAYDGNVHSNTNNINMKQIMFEMFENKADLLSDIESLSLSTSSLQPRHIDASDFTVLPLIGSAFCNLNTTANVFAVGAHHGESILSLSTNNCTHKSLRVYGFEGQENNYKIAVENTQNKYNNIHIFPFAISDKSQINAPFTSKDTVEIGGLFKHFEGLELTNYVNVTTFELFSKTNQIDVVDYTIMDVEGYEINAILGMNLENNLERFPMFQFENGDTWYDERGGTNLTHVSLLFYLQSLGFHLYVIGKQALYKANWELYHQVSVLYKTGNVQWKTFGHGHGGNMLAVNKKYIRKGFKTSILQLIYQLTAQGQNELKLEDFL